MAPEDSGAMSIRLGDHIKDQGWYTGRADPEGWFFLATIEIRGDWPAIAAAFFEHTFFVNLFYSN